MVEALLYKIAYLGLRKDECDWILIARYARHGALRLQTWISKRPTAP